MTRKDYEVIARVFRAFATDDDFNNAVSEPYAAGWHDCWAAIRAAIATELAIDNPRLDRERFYEACRRPS